MRRFIVGLAILAIAVLAPMSARADQQQDEQIAGYIVQQLQAQKQAGNLRGFRVNLKVENGLVYLQGHVSSPAQEELVLSIAQAATSLGVQKIFKSIQVEPAEAVLEDHRHSQTEARFSSRRQAQPEATNLEAMPLEPELPVEPEAPSLHGFVSTTSAGVPQNPIRLDAASSATAQGTGVAVTGRRRAARSASAPPAAPSPAAIAASPTPSPYYYYPPVQPRPLPFAMSGGAQYPHAPAAFTQPTVAAAVPAYMPAASAGVVPPQHDHPQMPGYAWPSYASHPNYAGVTYPRQYSPTAWPYIGPFYPYPQVPLGWRKVSLKWKDGWWFLDFHDK